METLNCQGILMQGQEVRKFLKKTRTFREFCCVKFIFSQSDRPNFENLLGEHAPRPLLTVLDTHKNLIVVWKSQGKVSEKSGSFIPSGN